VNSPWLGQVDNQRSHESDILKEMCSTIMSACVGLLIPEVMHDWCHGSQKSELQQVEEVKVPQV
jgi:hypothetical protein